MKNSAFAAGAACICLLLSSCGSDSAPAAHDASNVAATAASNGGSAPSGADSATPHGDSRTPGAGGAPAPSDSSNSGSADSDSSRNRRNPTPSPASSASKASKGSVLASVRSMASARVTMQVFSNDAANANPTNKNFGGVYDVTWNGEEAASVSPSDPKADVGRIFWKGKFAYLLRHAERGTVQAGRTVFSVGRVNAPLAQERQAGFAPCAQDGTFRVREATIEYDSASQAVTRLDLTTESTDLKAPNSSRAVSCRLVMAFSQVARS